MAVSDELGVTAQGVETLQRTNSREDYAALQRFVEERGVTGIVIGNPINMSGTEGRQAAWVRQFAEKLKEQTGLPVTMWDERLTSVEAGRVLRQSGISIEKRARAVDRLSAVLILQSYLDSLELASESGELLQ